MGLIGRVIEFLRTTVGSASVSDVKVNPGSGSNLTATHFQPAGTDAPPLAADYAFLVQLPGSSRYVVIGFLDPDNEGTASPGENRLYARDSDGNVVVTLRLANDGILHLGEDTGAAWMARADLVEAELEKIKTDLVAMGGKDVTPAATYTSVTSVACTKVKGT